MKKLLVAKILMLKVLKRILILQKPTKNLDAPNVEQELLKPNMTVIIILMKNVLIVIGGERDKMTNQKGGQK